MKKFYTGGGITLVEMRIDSNHIAVVSSEAPEYLTVYKEDDYLPENMLYSMQENELTTEMKKLYAEMYEKLNS